MTQAIPIPATSLLPFALLPIFQSLSDKEVASAYGHHMILLLLGGFLLSRGLECSGVHKRFALTMIRMCGLKGPRIVLDDAMRLRAGGAVPELEERRCVKLQLRGLRPEVSDSVAL